MRLTQRTHCAGCRTSNVQPMPTELPAGIPNGEWIEQATDRAMFHADVYFVAHLGQFLAEIPGEYGFYLWTLNVSARGALAELRSKVLQHNLTEIRRVSAECIEQQEYPLTEEAVEELWQSLQAMQDEDELSLAAQAAGGEPEVR